MEAFSDSSSQSPSFTTTSTDPRKLSTMLEAIETNLSDMFKVRGWGRSGSKTGWVVGARQCGEEEINVDDDLVILIWSISGLFPFSSSQLSLHSPLVGGGGSPVLGKAVPLQDTPTVFPDHTHPDTPPSSIIPEYVEGTCHLSPRGKMQVVTIRLILLGTLSGKRFISETFQRACDS